MKRYAKYKDSGISWIGEIPEHWGKFPFFALFEVKSECGFNDEELLSVYLDRGVVKYADVAEKRTNATSEDKSKYQLVKKGDFVLNNQQAWRGSVGVSFERGIVSPAYVVLSMSSKLDLEFANLLLRDKSMVAMYYVASKGVGSIQRNLVWNKLKMMPVFVPPLEEQKAIAGFLDNKTKQINELVSAKQKQIELLKEYKQAVIAKAVTQGINPKTKMKDSGISWIGQIPAYWMVDKLGHQFVQRKEKVSDKDFAPLSVSKMGVTPQLESACKSDDGDNRKLVCKGDFVVNSRSDRKGSCGFSELDGSVSLINIVATPRKMNGWYCHFLFRSNNYIEEFYRMGRGIVADLWTTRWSEMRTIMIPVPPPEEQSQIVAYIKEKVSAIDSQISSIEKQIANLNEYKQSLISDVVTGKVKVA